MTRQQQAARRYNRCEAVDTDGYCGAKTFWPTGKYCQRHYARFRRYGDASVCKMNKRPQGLEGAALCHWILDEANHRIKREVVVPELGECFLYTQRLWPNGYAVVGVGNTKHVLSSYIYRYLVGFESEIDPADTTDVDAPCALHKCDVRHCVNPDHLIEGTRSDRTRLSMSRGRHPSGADHVNAILTRKQVRYIRQEVTGGRTQVSVAGELGITPPLVSDIMTGKKYCENAGEPEMRPK